MCTNPHTVIVHEAGRTYEQRVSCGKCPECLNGKVIDYVEQIYFESLASKSVHFVTLTYDDEYLPFQVDHSSLVNAYDDRRHRADIIDEVCVAPSLRRKDVIQSLRRFRDDGYDFRYSFIGEYGKLGRPHYHGLIFGLEDKEVDLFCRNYWHRGFYVSKRVNFFSLSGRSDIAAVAKYVGKYLRKGSDDDDKVLNKVAELPRPFSSVSLGMQFIDRLRSWYLCEDVFGKVDIDKFPFPSGYVVRVLNRLQRCVIGDSVYPLANSYRRKILYCRCVDPLSGKVSYKASKLSHAIADLLDARSSLPLETKLAEIARISNETQRWNALQVTLSADAAVSRSRENVAREHHRQYLRKSRL